MKHTLVRQLGLEIWLVMHVEDRSLLHYIAAGGCQETKRLSCRQACLLNSSSKSCFDRTASVLCKWPDFWFLLFFPGLPSSCWSALLLPALPVLQQYALANVVGALWQILGTTYLRLLAVGASVASAAEVGLCTPWSSLKQVWQRLCRLPCRPYELTNRFKRNDAKLAHFAVYQVFVSSVQWDQPLQCC